MVGGSAIHMSFTLLKYTNVVNNLQSPVLYSYVPTKEEDKKRSYYEFLYLVN